MESRFVITIKNISVQPGPDEESTSASIDHILSIVKFLQTRLMANEEFMEFCMERDFAVMDWQPDVEVKEELGTGGAML